MAIPDKLKEHINNQDILAIRIMLKDRIILDPTFKEFDDIDSYIKKNHIHIYENIYEKPDDKEFEEQSEKWDKNYLNKQCVELVINFSEERVKHLRKVCKVVYQERIEKLESINKTSTTNEKKTNQFITDKEKSSAEADKIKKIVADTKQYIRTIDGKSTISAVSSSAVIATGVIIEKATLLLAGAVVAIGGLVLIILDKKDKK